MLNKLNKNFDSNINKKIKKLKTQLTFTVFLLLLILVIGVFIFLPVSWQKIAIALTGDYSKVSDTDQLTVDDWNSLPNDFLDKESPSGDTMAGPLNMSGNSITNLGNPSNDDEAVNRGSMNTAISSAISEISAGESDIKDVDGNELRMVCGKTLKGNTNWINAGELGTIKVTVNTEEANFVSNDIFYFVSIGGITQHYHIKGGNSIYMADNDSFKLFLVYNGSQQSTFDAIEAKIDYEWFVNWCGIGY